MQSVYLLFHYQKSQTRILKKGFSAEPGEEVKNRLAALGGGRPVASSVDKTEADQEGNQRAETASAIRHLNYNRNKHLHKLHYFYYVRMKVTGVRD